MSSSDASSSSCCSSSSSSKSLEMVDSSSSTRPRTKTVSLRKRLRKAIADAKRKVNNAKGPLTSAFPTADAFVSSLKGEQDRCLSEMKCQVTSIVDGFSFDFYFRDIMDVAHDAFGKAKKVQLRGRRQFDADGKILRSHSLDSNVNLLQEADVLRIHANTVHDGRPIKAFAMAVLFFSDATLLSWNGSEYEAACPCVWSWWCRWSACRHGSLECAARISVSGH